MWVACICFFRTGYVCRASSSSDRIAVHPAVQRRVSSRLSTRSSGSVGDVMSTISSQDAAGVPLVSHPLLLATRSSALSHAPRHSPCCVHVYLRC